MTISSHQNFIPTRIFSQPRHRFPGIWALGEMNFYEFTHSNQSAVLLAVDSISVALETEIRQAAKDQELSEHFFFGAMNGTHWFRGSTQLPVSTENVGWKTCQDFAVIDSRKLKMRCVFCVSVVLLGFKGSRIDKPGRCLSHGSCENCFPLRNQQCHLIHTVDGRNPAPVHR